MFKCNSAGIAISLEIKRQNNNMCYDDDEWCLVSFKLTSGKMLRYECEDAYVLRFSEIRELHGALTKLLMNEYKEETVVNFEVPDFEFYLFPVFDLKKNPNFLYVNEEGRFTKINLDWRIYFWNGAVSTSNYLSVNLDKEQIIELRDYLRTILN